MNKILRNKRAICLFLLPAVLAYCIIILWPMFQSIAFTFFEGTPNVNMEFVGLKNYAKLLHDRDFISSFWITMRFVVVVAGCWVVLGLVTALVFAYGLRKRYVNFARTLVYIPVVIPSVAAAAICMKIFEIEPNYGLVNELLRMLGLEKWVQPWIGQSSTALGTLCFTDAWRGFGYYAIVLYAGILNIPREIEEAAIIDGCSKLKVIRHITLPMLRPVTVMSVVLAVNHALRVYDMPAVMTGGGPGRSTQVLSLYMYKQAFGNWKYGYGSAVAVVMLILSVILMLGISLFDRRKEN